MQEVDEAQVRPQKIDNKKLLLDERSQYRLEYLILDVTRHRMQRNPSDERPTRWLVFIATASSAQQETDHTSSSLHEADMFSV